MRGLLLLLMLVAAPALALPPNIVLVVMDDVTACWIEEYGTNVATSALCNSEAYETPIIQLVANAGVTVTHAWAQPVCSPYRASIMTGTQPREHGLGRTARIPPTSGRPGLNAARQSLPRSLEAGGYTTRVFGKWHLSSFASDQANIRHPIAVGFGGGNGTLEQTDVTVTGVGGVGYYDWENCNFLTGSCVRDTDYATSQIVDDAIAVLDTLQEPWFMYLPFQAPHSPFHVPPANLITNDTACDTYPGDAVEDCYNRAIEALDSELGRLLSDPNFHSEDTIIIITADNGTPNGVANSIANLTNASWVVGRCKGEVTECGLWVPLIVQGGGVGIEAGTTADILVSATDIHATILELAGVENIAAGWNTGSKMPSLGGREYLYRSVSFADNLKDTSLPSRRSCIYAERFHWEESTGLITDWHEGIRNATHKLMRNHDVGETYAEEFFLTSSIYEVAPDDHITASGADYDFLSAAMDAMNEPGGDPCR